MKEKRFKRNKKGGSILGGVVILLGATVASLISAFIGRGIINLVTETEWWKKKMYPRIKNFVLKAERLRDSFLRSFKKKEK